MVKRKKYKGVYTIEIACMMPVIILVLTGVVILSFYFHDKNIMYDKAYEIGAVARQELRSPQGLDVDVVQEWAQTSSEDKLLLFDTIICNITHGSQSILVHQIMEKGGYKVEITREFTINNVEKSLRNRQLFG